jgi:hypothetical protein
MMDAPNISVSIYRANLALLYIWNVADAPFPI